LYKKINMHNLALINNLFCKVVLFIFMKILIKKAKTTIFDFFMCI